MGAPQLAQNAILEIILHHSPQNVRIQNEPTEIRSQCGGRSASGFSPVTLAWMSARAARRARRQTRANRHQHSHPPSREELRRQVERQQREIEQLREQVSGQCAGPPHGTMGACDSLVGRDLSTDIISLD